MFPYLEETKDIVAIKLSLWPDNFKDAFLVVITNCSGNIKWCWKIVTMRGAADVIELLHVSR